MRFGTTLATTDFMSPRQTAPAKPSSASLTAKRANGFRTCRLQEREIPLRLWETITFSLQLRLLPPREPHRYVSNLDFPIPVASRFFGLSKLFPLAEEGWREQPVNEQNCENPPSPSGRGQGEGLKIRIDFF